MVLHFAAIITSCVSITSCGVTDGRGGNPRLDINLSTPVSERYSPSVTNAATLSTVPLRNGTPSCCRCQRKWRCFRRRWFGAGHSPHFVSVCPSYSRDDAADEQHP